MAYAKHKQKGIHHVCLRVPDLLRTRDFYLKALDAELVAEWGTPGEENHAFILDLGTGDYLEIFGSGKVFDVGSWQHLAVWTDDIEAAVRRALEAGAEPVSPPRDADIATRSGDTVRLRYAFVRAPGREILEFIQDR